MEDGRIEAARTRLWSAVAVAALVLAAACALSGFRLAPGSGPTLLGFASLILIALCIRDLSFGRWRSAAVMADGFLLFLVLSTLGVLATYLAMRHSGALTDDWLDRADHALGFDWRRTRAAVDRSPTALAILRDAYAACFFLPMLVVAALPAGGHADRLYRYLAVHGVALALTAAVAAFFPARATFAYYGYHPLPGNAEHYGRIIAALRGGAPMMVDLDDLGGIVTFPSFHAATAVLFAWALWPLRRLRVPVIAINAAMWVSAMPIGGHYLVDALGGTAVAIAAIALVPPRRETVAIDRPAVPVRARRGRPAWSGVDAVPWWR